MAGCTDMVYLSTDSQSPIHMLSSEPGVEQIC